MKKSKNDFRSQQDQKGQLEKQSDKTQKKQSQNNSSTKNTKGSEEKSVGTKMPGRETRTPVAGKKSSKSQSVNKGNK